MKIKRDKLANSGQWTHQYGDAGKTASTGEKLLSDTMQIQWFGKRS